MRATVTLDKDMLDELVQETGLKSAASAVREAISEYLKLRKIDKIKAMKGKLRFDKTAEELRHYER